MRPINYDGKGSVMAYHAIVNVDGSTTEHTAMVSLASIVSADGNTLILTCPTCGASAWVPITGGREAQRLHAMVRVVRGTQPDYSPAATRSVIGDVQALGGIPRIPVNDNPLNPR